MTPPQKQPAVTREEAELLLAILDKPGNAMKREYVQRLLDERDEALREVERLKVSVEAHKNQAIKEREAGEVILKALEAEKRRAAVLLDALQKYGRHEYECYEDSRCPGYCECGWSDADAPHRKLLIEATKILATQEDSGGEKDFKNQQKGDSRDGNAS